MNSRILVVDDEFDILQVLKSLLEREGYQVTTASSGAEALKLFQLDPADVLITDMKMPVMDGLELMQRIKAILEDTEVIILTGFGTVKNAVESMKNGGAFDYLTKPLENIDDLLVTISKALERRRLRLDNKLLLYQLKQSNEELHSRVLELKTLQSIYKAIVEGVPVGIALLDSSSRVLFANDRMGDLLNRLNDPKREPLCELAGNGLFQQLNIVEALKRALAGEAVNIPQQLVRSSNSERELVLDIKAIPLRESGERAHFVLVIIEDISERVRMEATMKRMDRLSALGELSAGIAHEIRNPLAGVSSSAQILAERIQGRELEALTANILNGAARMEKIVKDVLDFARPQQAQLSACDLKEVVHQALRLISPQAKHKGIRLALDLPRQIRPLKLDAAQIQQVVVNLLLNSIRATPAGGTISLNLKHLRGTRKRIPSTKPCVALSVSDNGHGIHPDHLNKIFNPFFTTCPDGTGLGLAISYSILKQHNVDVQVKSKPGGGTTFHLQFPAN